MSAPRQSGFTLLEVLVATLIMGIAVAGILSGMAGASRNAARLTDIDRATLLAKQKMDELLLDRVGAAQSRHRRGVRSGAYRRRALGMACSRYAV